MITRLKRPTFDAITETVRTRLDEAGLDGIVVDHAEDIAYLTGFFHFPTERPVYVWLGTDGSTVLLVPELEREYAAAQQAAAEIVHYSEYPALRPAETELPISGERVGFAPGLAHDRLQRLTAAHPRIQFVPSTAVTDARARKRPEELVLHREAARITDLMLAEGQDWIRRIAEKGEEFPTERELGSYVTGIGTAEMERAHADVVVVPILAGGLVYAGANSAFPHGMASDYRMRPGDSFMLSLGCAVGGRYVEGERTFILGQPSDQQRSYYKAVQQAQQVGAEALRPGSRCSEVNRACLTVLHQAGFGRFIRHRQGHGIGLGFHEPPWLSEGDDTIVEPGMIFSNEPGLYVPGHAGYRISDSMLVTETGSERLTGFPRDLDSVVING